MAQSVERVLGKDEVTGSNPVSSSKAESYHESGRILLFNALFIGLFNFVAKILNQYLGHWVSILCFFTGGIMMLLSFILCGGSI